MSSSSSSSFNRQKKFKMKSSLQTYFQHKYILAGVCVSILLLIVNYNSQTNDLLRAKKYQLIVEHNSKCNQTVLNSPAGRELVDLTIPDECAHGFIEWKAPSYNGYMRILFESGHSKCTPFRDNEFRVCMTMNRASNVWDVTRGVSNRDKIILFRNNTEFCTKAAIKSKEVQSKSNRLELLISVSSDSESLEYRYSIKCHPVN